MKKLYMLAAAGLCSMALMTACSENGSVEAKVSKATECANGVTEACLIGEWSYVGLVNDAGLAHVAADYSQAPGKLTFNEGGKFVFEGAVASRMSSTCLQVDLGNLMGGKWTLTDGTLHLTANSTCVGSNSLNVVPQVKVDGGVVTMNFGKGNLWFAFNEGLTTVERNYYAETFTAK